LVNGKFNTTDIINGISAGLSIIDSNFRIVWVNKIQTNWFGPSKDICGKKCFHVYKRTDQICKNCPTEKVFKTGKAHTGMNTSIDKFGNLRNYYLTVTPIKDKNQRTRYAVELVQDITEKIQQEKKKSKIMHSLKRMHNNLSQVNKKLFTSIKRLKVLTGNVLHTNHIITKKYQKNKSKLVTIQDELEGILKVNRKLSLTNDSKKTSSLITKSICELMNTDSCVLSLLDEERNALNVNSVYGLKEPVEVGLPCIKVGDGISGMVALTRKPFASSDMFSDTRIKFQDFQAMNVYFGLAKEAGIKSVLVVPIILHNKVLGVISTYSKKKRYFKEEEIEILMLFASQVAIAVEETKHNEDIHKNYFNTMHALVLAIEARDPYTRGHTERVTKYSLEYAKATKMTDGDVEILRFASEVHDVGKISIPDFILNKPGKLTHGERAMIELHPVKGAQMLEPLEFLKSAIPIVRHHHERFDGTGYPDGLEKDKIPFFARIIACADAFDAMTSERPYRRNKLSLEEAIMEIKNNSGSQFDPQIAQTFIKIVRNSGT